MKKLFATFVLLAIGVTATSMSININDNVEKIEQTHKGKFRVYVTKLVVSDGMATTVVLEDYVTTNCLDFLQADALRVSKQNSYLPEVVQVSVTKVSTCASIPLG